MCGIAGFLTPSGLARGARQVAQAMTDAIAHRGPDDEGLWLDEGAGVALGHRRLAMIDVSAAGHQPMASPSGRYVLIYNGEIYNFHDLRAELEAAGAAPAWRGHSDTEVMLAAIDAYGASKARSSASTACSPSPCGTEERRVLTLGRDRLGEKPLYYGWHAGTSFLFGSELKALAAHPDFTRAINRGALAALPAPLLRAGAAQHLGGHRQARAWLPRSDNRRSAAGRSARRSRYWDFRAAAIAGARDPLPAAAEN